MAKKYENLKFLRATDNFCRVVQPFSSRYLACQSSLYADVLFASSSSSNFVLDCIIHSGSQHASFCTSILFQHHRNGVGERRCISYFLWVCTMTYFQWKPCSQPQAEDFHSKRIQRLHRSRDEYGHPRNSESGIKYRRFY